MRMVTFLISMIIISNAKAYFNQWYIVKKTPNDYKERINECVYTCVQKDGYTGFKIDIPNATCYCEINYKLQRIYYDRQR